jgi:hypothetical protein
VREEIQRRKDGGAPSREISELRRVQ